MGRRSIGSRRARRELAAEPFHAFDSESNSGFVYRERLCLLQFNVGGRLWLVDLVALGETDDILEVIREPLVSSETRTYLHGGEFDVGSMKRDFDISLGGVFDTQQAASFLGWEKTGYGAVVERICGVGLDKAFAHHDWSKRPVNPKALHYALDDVRYLPEAALALEREVEEADLADEVSIANRTVMEATWSSPTKREGLWRLKGVQKLDPSRLPRLAALWDWREAEAKRRDLPPGRLLHPEAMLALARRQARTPRDLRSAGLRGRNAGYADEIFDVLRRAETKPPRVPDRPVGERPSPGRPSVSSVSGSGGGRRRSGAACHSRSCCRPPPCSIWLGTVPTSSTRCRSSAPSGGGSTARPWPISVARTSGAQLSPADPAPMASSAAASSE